MKSKFVSPCRGILEIEGREVPFVVRVRPQLKNRYSYRLDPLLGLLISVPQGHSPRSAVLGLEAKREWLLKALAHRKPCGNMLFGEPLRIEFVALGHKLGQLCADRLLLPELGHDRALQVRQWYSLQAAEYVRKRLPELAQAMGVRPKAARIRDQRTRWGSCSSLGNLNFSWRLVMAPTFVFEATLIHELAHLVELNHSTRFWQVVHKHCPRYAEADKWLKEHGSSLRAWSYVASEGVGK